MVMEIVKLMMIGKLETPITPRPQVPTGFPLPESEFTISPGKFSSCGYNRPAATRLLARRYHVLFFYRGRKIIFYQASK
jgi:hypothetical protein